MAKEKVKVTVEREFDDEASVEVDVKEEETAQDVGAVDRCLSAAAPFLPWLRELASVVWDVPVDVLGAAIAPLLAGKESDEYVPRGGGEAAAGETVYETDAPAAVAKGEDLHVVGGGGGPIAAGKAEEDEEQEYGFLGDPFIVGEEEKKRDLPSTVLSPTPDVDGVAAKRAIGLEAPAVRRRGRGAIAAGLNLLKKVKMPKRPSLPPVKQHPYAFATFVTIIMIYVFGIALLPYACTHSPDKLYWPLFTLFFTAITSVLLRTQLMIRVVPEHTPEPK